MEETIKNAINIENTVDPKVSKATEDILKLVIDSIESAGINLSYVEKNDFGNMTDDLHSNVIKLNRAFAKSSKYARYHKVKDLELEIDLMLKDIVIDVICLQIKRGKMGVEY